MQQLVSVYILLNHLWGKEMAEKFSETVSFDVSKKHAPTVLGDVLVLGLGKSGKAASTYFAKQLGSRVASLTVYAGTSSVQAQDFAKSLTSQGAVVLFDTEEVTGSYDLCVASPGISENSAFYQSAASCSKELISEVELAWRESAKDSVWVAITGTNGKTTTTSLIAHVLKECGKNVCAVGNIGDACIEEVSKEIYSCYVAEVSSYQLASIKHFAPEVAVLLNITPDHLKWHGSFEAYAKAKQNIYANCTEDATVILDATNEVVRGFVRELKNDPSRKFRSIPMGTAAGIQGNMRLACGSDNAAFIDVKGVLCLEYPEGRFEIIAGSDLQIKGEHNASNALAAAAAAHALGCSVSDIARALASFMPLEHRIEPCGSIEGIECYNDSKATNVDATLKALAAFGEKQPIVLLGGDDKGTDLAELVEQACRHCKAVVCFGEAGPRFLEAFSHASIPVYRASHLEDALDEALSHATSGDIVALSPACASFDEFSCFEERGEVFKQLVAQRSKERGA